MIVEITKKSELDNILENQKEDELVYVKFGATWCQPCMMFESIINEVKDGLPNVKFVFVDCDESETELLELHHVTNIPRSVLYKEGLVVDSFTGLLQKDKLLEKINEKLTK